MKLCRGVAIQSRMNGFIVRNAPISCRFRVVSEFCELYDHWESFSYYRSFIHSFNSSWNCNHWQILNRFCDPSEVRQLNAQTPGLSLHDVRHGDWGIGQIWWCVDSNGNVIWLRRPSFLRIQVITVRSNHVRILNGIPDTSSYIDNIASVMTLRHHNHRRYMNEVRVIATRRLACVSVCLSVWFRFSFHKVDRRLELECYHLRSGLGGGVRGFGVRFSRDYDPFMHRNPWQESAVSLLTEYWMRSIRHDLHFSLSWETWQVVIRQLEDWFADICIWVSVHHVSRDQRLICWHLWTIRCWRKLKRDASIIVRSCQFIFLVRLRFSAWNASRERRSNRWCLMQIEELCLTNLHWNQFVFLRSLKLLARPLLAFKDWFNYVGDWITFDANWSDIFGRLFIAMNLHSSFSWVSWESMYRGDKCGMAMAFTATDRSGWDWNWNWT
jgi:hypothetical protein